MSGFLFKRVLLTNDDGFGAPGLLLLERIAARLAEEVWVVAPEHDRSGAGQSISLHMPLRLYPYGKRRYALSGTPADCVFFAVGELMGKDLPDLVLSGVNCGANLSDSIQYSGTVGAVLAAEHMGLPAIALSQAYFDRDQMDWSPVETYAEPLIRELWQQSAEACCWNLNFPACAAEAISHARLTQPADGCIRRPRLRAGEDSRGLPYWWLGFERDSKHILAREADVTALRDKCISVSPMRHAGGWPAFGDMRSASELAGKAE